MVLSRFGLFGQKFQNEFIDCAAAVKAVRLCNALDSRAFLGFSFVSQTGNYVSTVEFIERQAFAFSVSPQIRRHSNAGRELERIRRTKVDVDGADDRGGKWKEFTMRLNRIQNKN